MLVRYFMGCFSGPRRAARFGRRATERPYQFAIGTGITF